MPYGSSNLVVDLVISSYVTSINKYAFYGCKSITSLVIPSSIASIGTSAFCNCSNLINISVDGDSI